MSMTGFGRVIARRRGSAWRCMMQHSTRLAKGRTLTLHWGARGRGHGLCVHEHRASPSRGTTGACLWHPVSQSTAR
jgi:hypothetical protein